MRTALAIVTLATWSSLAQAGPLPSLAASVTLLVHDTFGLTSTEMDTVRGTVVSILALASVDVEWRLCTAAPGRGGAVGCAAPRNDAELLIRIVASTRKTPARTLGSALIDRRRSGGVLATVYADRVDALAFRAGVNRGVLLGRAAAHEVGHLLTGRSAHARSGLMRGRWSLQDVRREAAGDWSWSPQELAEMRRSMDVRTHAASMQVEVNGPQ